MIFVSSACVKNKYIKDSVQELVDAGFRNIELSGGTQPYPEMLDDLKELQDKYNLNFICHNYFPPPEIPFVMNLASLDNEIADLTLQTIDRAITISKELGQDKLGVHAGFLMNIPVNEIGKSIQKQKLFIKQDALEAFQNRLQNLRDLYPEMEFYIENNVINDQNYKNFEGENPLFLCDYQGLKELEELAPVNLLLDVAHLKVSCKTLGLNFDHELEKMINRSDYIHISDNDGLSDSNQSFVEDSTLFKKLKQFDFSNKIVTIEVYGNLTEIKKSYICAEKLFE